MMDIPFKIKAVLIEYKYLLLFLIFGFWTFPISTFLPDSGLDPSWGIGINLAYLNNFQFGTNVIFTYGLLGFLGSPSALDYSFWELHVIFSILSHFLFVFSVYLFLKHFSAKWYHYLLFIPILLFILPVMPCYWELLISISIFLYLILLQKDQLKIVFGCLVVGGFLLAVDSLIKFDMLWNSLYLLLGFCVITFVLKRDTRQSAILVCSYLGSFFAVWFISQQPLSNIIAYLIGGFELTKGYTEAMMYPGPFWQVCIGLISILILLIMGIFFLIRKNIEGCSFLILNLVILFSAFKTGFIRHDNHILEFLCVFTVYFGILLVLMMNSSKNYDKKVGYIISIFITVSIGIFMATTYITGPWVLQNNIVTHGSYHESTLQLLSNQTHFETLVDLQKEKIMKDYSINISVLKSIDNSSVDIFPWDIALCWAYDLNWSPRPEFQSYSAYTTYLDTINSQHFSDPTSSPDKILYSYESIDGRYPLFDEPKTFMTIINNYTYADESGGFILLNRTKVHNETGDVNLGFTTAQMGAPIKIPTSKGEIFGNVNIKYSLLGTLLKTVYKPAPVYVTFQLKNGFNSPRYKIIPDTAMDGLYLSQYVSDTDTLGWIFQGHQINNIDSIIIETDQPVQYSKDIGVTFKAKPFPTTITENSLVTWRIIPQRTAPEQQSVMYVFKSINGNIEPALFEHSLNGGSQMIINNISIPEKSLLKFELALDPQTWSPDKGDGVEYQIFVNSTAPENLVFSQYIDPKHNVTEQKWNPYQADLSPYAGTNITLIFSTLPGPKNNTDWDWAWWGDPRITS